MHPGYGRGRRAIRTMNPIHGGRGWLKNDNRPGDLSRAIPCGAKRRPGAPCKTSAMRNGRCRMHGGASTDLRTAEGLQRSRRANWKTGSYLYPASSHVFGDPLDNIQDDTTRLLIQSTLMASRKLLGTPLPPLQAVS